jgi:hypothetical protein
MLALGLWQDELEGETILGLIKLNVPLESEIGMSNCLEFHTRAYYNGRKLCRRCEGY